MNLSKVNLSNTQGTEFLALPSDMAAVAKPYLVQDSVNPKTVQKLNVLPQQNLYMPGLQIILFYDW